MEIYIRDLRDQGKHQAANFAEACYNESSKEWLIESAIASFFPEKEVTPWEQWGMSREDYALGLQAAINENRRDVYLKNNGDLVTY